MPRSIDIFRPEPLIHTDEEFSMDVGTKKRGDVFEVILNYKVIDDTKSFKMLRITGMNLKPSKRLLT